VYLRVWRPAGTVFHDLGTSDPNTPLQLPGSWNADRSRGFLAALLGLAGPAVRHGGGSAARQTPANSRPRHREPPGPALSNCHCVRAIPSAHRERRARRHARHRAPPGSSAPGRVHEPPANFQARPHSWRVRTGVWTALCCRRPSAAGGPLLQAALCCRRPSGQPRPIVVI
jgi:hypothetical protein